MMENKIVVPPKFLKFLVDWLAWATADAEGDYRFRRYAGLCTSYDRWCRQKGIWYGEERDDLVRAFIACGLDKNYPFGEDNYDDRSLKYTQHLDPARLAWVRKVIRDNSGGE